MDLSGQKYKERRSVTLFGTIVGPVKNTNILQMQLTKELFSEMILYHIKKIVIGIPEMTN